MPVAFVLHTIIRSISITTLNPDIFKVFFPVFSDFPIDKLHCNAEDIKFFSDIFDVCAEIPQVNYFFIILPGVNLKKRSSRCIVTVLKPHNERIGLLCVVLPLILEKRPLRHC